jgi:tRNA-dihydrouridine synthase
MNEAELGFELKNALARIEQLEAEVRRYASEAVIANTSVERLEAALRAAADLSARVQTIARAALAEEQDK